MKNNAVLRQKNRKLETVAAVMAFLGGVGYLIRMISHYTYYVIKIKYAESVIYGLIPAVLAVLLGILLLSNIKSRPVLTAVPAVAMCVYTVVLMFVNKDDSQDDSISTSLLSIALIVLASVIYTLTCTGVIRNRVPAIVINGVSIALYAMLSVVTVIYYAGTGDSFGTYYGYVTATFGLVLFFVALLLALISMGTEPRTKESEKM